MLQHFLKISKIQSKNLPRLLPCRCLHIECHSCRQLSSRADIMQNCCLCTSANSSKQKRCFSLNKNLRNNDLVDKVKATTGKLTERAEASLVYLKPEAKSLYNNALLSTKLFLTNSLTQGKTFAVCIGVARRKFDSPSNANFTYDELMKFQSGKEDAMKIAPLVPMLMFMPLSLVVAASALPVWFIPQYVVPTTFWSPQQRLKYMSMMHLSRLHHYAIVVNNMNFHKLKSKNLKTKYILDELCNVSTSGEVPTNEQVVKLRPLCRSAPFNDEDINYILLRSFAVAAGVPSYQPSDWLKYRLEQVGNQIVALDLKLKEQGVTKLSSVELEDACFMRGLNSAELSREVNLYWLENWLQLTTSAHDGDVMPCHHDDVWFVLHASVLLSQNYDETKFEAKCFD